MQSCTKYFAVVTLIFATSGATSQIATTFQIGKPDTPTLGLPYTADQTIHIVQHLGNGLVVTHDVTGRLARNADGVERYEGTFPSTDPAHPGSTTIACIIDRYHRTSITLNTTRKTATRQSLPAVATVTVQVLPLQGSGPRIKPENVTIADLGKKTMGMLPITGRLVSASIPIGQLGNDQPLPMTTEVWIAPELKLVVRQIEKNPQFGERTLELTNIRGEEPDPALFQIPAGYAISDRAPVQTAPGQVATTLVSPTVAPVPVPEQRTKQIEDALNNPDPLIKNNIAFALALNRDHLADAQLLTQQAILLKEQQVADAVSGADHDKAFDQMVGLSRFWDTAGYVFYRAGKPEKAEPYLRAAWELNPNSEFAIHLGLAYEAQHKTQNALAIYRMALSAKPSPAIQDALQTSLARLGQANAPALPIDITTPAPPLTLTLSPGEEPPTFDILLSYGHSPAITWLKGDKTLQKPVSQAVETALSSSLPDSGPEFVIRRAQLTCDLAACALHFTNTREFTTAEQARRNSQR
jgi:tetratricopeptide (TPR) repeat protein